MKKVMLNQDRKICFYILMLLLFSACRYERKDMQEIRDRTFSFSREIIGEKEYWNIYNSVNDSIHNWQENQLGLWKYYGESVDYLVDSVFCVNRNKNKIIFSILRRHPDIPDVADSIWYFFGVKVNNQWLFFDGPSLVIIREKYEQSAQYALSFDKLKMIAADHIYRRYLKKNLFGKWEINDNFFSDLTSVAWCIDCKTQEDWDAAYLRQVNDNWEKPKSEDEDKDKEWFLPMK